MSLGVHARLRVGRSAIMEFAQSYPTRVRMAARVVASVMLLAACLYVVPHVVDMVGPSQVHCVRYC